MKVMKYMLLTALIMCGHSMMAMQALNDMQNKVARDLSVNAEKEKELRSEVLARFKEIKQEIKGERGFEDIDMQWFGVAARLYKMIDTTLKPELTRASDLEKAAIRKKQILYAQLALNLDRTGVDEDNQGNKMLLDNLQSAYKEAREAEPLYAGFSQGELQTIIGAPTLSGGAGTSKISGAKALSVGASTLTTGAAESSAGESEIEKKVTKQIDEWKTYSSYQIARLFDKWWFLEEHAIEYITDEIETSIRIHKRAEKETDVQKDKAEKKEFARQLLELGKNVLQPGKEKDIQAKRLLEMIENPQHTMPVHISSLPIENDNEISFEEAVKRLNKAGANIDTIIKIDKTKYMAGHGKIRNANDDEKTFGIKWVIECTPAKYYRSLYGADLEGTELETLYKNILKYTLGSAYDIRNIAFPPSLGDSDYPWKLIAKTHLHALAHDETAAGGLNLGFLDEYPFTSLKNIYIIINEKQKN